MYEARQNKEKVSRRIYGEGSRVKQRVKVKKKFYPSAIQRVPFNTFVSNLQNDQERNKVLYVYTHVLADGWGDIGMLNNFASILSQYKQPLGIGDIKKIGTIQNCNEAKEKAKRMKETGFEQIETIGTNDTNNNGTPAIETRGNIKVPQSEWEIQSPVPDILSILTRGKDPKFTFLGEMGTDLIGLMITTMKATDDGESTGLILPFETDEKNYEKEIPNNLITFLGIEEEEFKSCRTLLPKIAIINVRLEGDGSNRPSIGIVEQWRSNTGYDKVLLLGKGQEQETSTNNVLLIERLDGELLHHMIKKMPQEGLIVAGGEGLFSEALGWGKSIVAFGSRYNYQINAMKQCKKAKGLTNFEKELDSMSFLTSNGIKGKSADVSSFDEFGKMSNLLRENSISDYIKRIIYMKKSIDIMKLSSLLFLRM